MQIDSNKNLVLNLTLDATNMVLKSLSAQPYEHVAGIISSIQQQASVQLQPVQEEVAAVDSKDPAAAE